MAKITSFDRFIPTLLEKKNDGIYAFAYCPICDKTEQSHAQHRDQQLAIAASIEKIRAHMRLRHRMKSNF